MRTHSVLFNAAKANRFVLSLFLAFTWMLTGWSYLRDGKGFVRLHLAVPTSIEPESGPIVVNAISVFGSVEPFKLDPHNPGNWSLKQFTGNIKTIEIQGLNPSLAEDIRIFSAWEDSAAPRYAINTSSINYNKSYENGIGRISITRKLPSSQIPKLSKSLNWIGDIHFVLITLLQSLVIVLATEIFVNLVSRFLLTAPEANTSHITHALKFIPRQLVLSSAYCFIAILLLQISNRLSLNLFDIRDSAQQIGLGIIQLSVLLGFRICLTYCRNERQSIAVWGTALLGLFLLKAIWIMQVSTFQCNDYGIYWETGRAMSDGNWGAIDTEGPLALVLLRRSWAWCSWVAKIFGSTETALETANFLLQLATVSLFSWYVKSRFGTNAMAAATISFVIHPEIWLTSTLASHDLPALFWFVVLLFPVDHLCHRITSPLTQVIDWFLLAFASICVGIVVALLDMQRDFGPFALLSLASMAILWTILSPWKNWLIIPRIGKVAFASSIMLCSVGFSSFLLNYQITSRYPNLEKLSVAAFVTSVESKERPTVDHMQPWRFLYYPSIPNDKRLTFSINKLIHEKLVRIDQYRTQVTENTKQLGGSGGLIGFTFGGRPGNFMPDSPIPWHSFLYAISAWLETTLGLFFILRVLMCWKTGLSSFELFPLFFCIGQSFAVILLGEVNSSYDSFLVLPYSLAAGILFGSASRYKHNSEKEDPKFHFVKTNLAKLFFDNAVPILGASTLISLFLLVNPSVPQVFSVPKSVIAVSPTPDDSRVTFDDEGVYVDLSRTINSSNQDISNTPLTVRWNVDCKENQQVHFFLAGNQRKLKLASPSLQKNSESVLIELKINDSVHFSGKLSALEHPKWQSFIPFSERTEFELTVISHESRSTSIPLGVSVEYFWQPGLKEQATATIQAN